LCKGDAFLLEYYAIAVFLGAGVVKKLTLSAN
jgi:hypothetical protein